MLNLINNLRFDRLQKSKNFSFKTDLENYNLSELNGQDMTSIDHKHLSLDWISLYRRQ